MWAKNHGFDEKGDQVSFVKLTESDPAPMTLAI